MQMLYIGAAKKNQIFSRSCSTNKTIMSKKILPIFLLFTFCFASQNTISAQEANQIKGAEDVHIKYLGKSKPLRDLVAGTPTDLTKLKKSKSERPKVIPNFVGRGEPVHVNPKELPNGPDPVWQSSMNRSAGIPVEPIVNVEGIGEDVAGLGVPDPCGVIGKNHYVQVVNASWIQVFDKAGNMDGNPIPMNTLWSQFGTQSGGDPIILYDQEAERWIITEFAPPFGPSLLLIAVSDTDDPTGSYNAYQFSTAQFPDYPKYSIWSNMYLMTSNEGGGGLAFYLLDRQALLAGAVDVDLQRLSIPNVNAPGFYVATPVNWSGNIAPPATTKPMIMRVNDDAWGEVSTDRVEIFTIDNVDWDDPSNTVISGPMAIETSPFDTDVCAAPGPNFACIPQPGGGGIDGIPYVLMHQVHYRNFGASESIVMNFVVDASGAQFGGIRWIELRKTSSTSNWSLYQEGTYAMADEGHRFMGGIAIDDLGNIGLGYSVSGPNTFPSLRFTGRRAGDPLGEMTIDEYEVVTGLSSIPAGRFGDYASMNVDPENGRTFWYTGEYAAAGSSWATRVFAFELNKDTNDIGPVALLTPQSASDLTATESVSVRVTNFGLDSQFVFDVGFTFDNGAVISDQVTTVLPPDSSYTHTFASTVDMAAIKDYDFVIFTTLGSDQNILNDTLPVTRSQYPRFDAAITDIINEDFQICGAEATLRSQITNRGTETLTSATITPIINGATLPVINWTGSLAFGDSELFDLPITNLIDGDNTLEVRVSNPNGQIDEVAANDADTESLNVLIDGVMITLELRTDRFPEETSWRLTLGGLTAFTGGPYGGRATELITETWCLDPNACYNFTISDSYGDGMDSFGSQNDGNYEIKDEQGRVLAALMNVDFGFSESTDFCATFVCTLDAEISVTNTSSMTASDGAISVQAQNGTGPFTYSLNNGTPQSSNSSTTCLLAIT